jgi:hypothetical protein
MLFRVALNESKKNFLCKQYGLTPEQVDLIAEADPTNSVNKNTYTAWLCKVVKDGKSIESLSTLTEPLKKFMRLLNSPEFPADKKDIGRYTPESLLQLVGSDRKYRRNLSQSAIEKMIMNEGVPGAKLIWNSDGFKMWEVTNPEYARFLSSNTSWCTAQVAYSNQYCNKGALYPVYFKGKPLAQGYYTSDMQDITFLDVQDQAVKLSDPIIMGMLQTITNEPMNIFRRKSMTGQFLNRMGGNWEDVKPAADLCLKFGLARGIEALCLRFNWPEGFEFLLDYPRMLYTVLDNRDDDETAKLVNEQPELAEEMLYEASKVGEKGSLATLAFGLDENSQREFFDGDIDLFIGKSGLEVNSKVVEEILLDKIRNTSKHDMSGHYSSLIRQFMNNNKWGYTQSVFEYWKKFWPADASGLPRIEEALKQHPEYAERMAIIKEIPSRYRVGDIIELGPDYTGGHTGTAKVVAKSGGSVTLEFEDGGTGASIGNDPKAGRFWLGRVVTPSEAPIDFEVLKDRPSIRSLRKGTKVVINPETWRKSDVYNPDEEEMGTIQSIDRYDETVKVLWNDDPEKRTRGSYGYDRLLVVRDLNEPVAKATPASVGEKVALDPIPSFSELREGMRVMKGPQWNDEASEPDRDITTGVITRLDDDGERTFVYVQWDGEAIERGGYYYDDEIKRVLPYREVEAAPTTAVATSLKDLPSPSALGIGMRVKRGPTWEWDDQDEDEDGNPGIGIIRRFPNNPGGWVSIEWPQHTDNYRYGYCQGDSCADFVPEDFAFNWSHMDRGSITVELEDWVGDFDGE